MATQSLRGIRVEGNIAHVPLTKGYETIIDAADVPLIERWRWKAGESQAPQLVYACRSVRDGKASREQSLHRLLMGNPAGLLVDHINGNTLDNRRANLRLATKAQNQTNTRMRSNNKSGYRGVHWRSDSQKWCSQIRANGKVRTLGSFTTVEAAAEAYRKAAAECHGDFSPLFSRPEFLTLSPTSRGYHADQP